MATFEDKVQAPPPELFNEVYDLTFTASSSIVHIYETYQTSALMRVSRASRAKFKTSYFKDTTFYIHRNLLPWWAASIEKGDIQPPSQIRVIGNPFEYVIGSPDYVDDTMDAEDLYDWVAQECELFYSLTARTFDQALLQGSLRFEVSVVGPEMSLLPLRVARSDFDENDHVGVSAWDWCTQHLEEQLRELDIEIG